MKNLFFALRPKQWIKNLFIFLPLIFGKKLFSYDDNLKTLIAFFLFCITSSAAYVINDIIDIKEDKHHPTKRLRPIASGKMSIKQANLMAFILGTISISSSFLLNLNFGLVMLGYLISNFVYSIALKELVIIDVFCIGVFFLLRIIAGGIIARVQLSHWFIFMTVLLALFLGFNKRRQELKMLKRKTGFHRALLNMYSIDFIDQMVSTITASIVIVYLLYVVDLLTCATFKMRNIIYTIPFVYYGIFRYLYLVYKVGKEGDPTSLLLVDKPMQLNLLLWIVICIAVIYF